MSTEKKIPVGARKLLLAGTVCGLLGPVIRILCGTNITGLLISNIFTSLFQVPVSMLMNVYIYECMDYGEWKTGLRIDGLISSVNSVVAKVALGVSSVGCGFLLGLAHYDGALAVQPESALNMIQALYNIIPAVLAVVGVIFAFLYNLEKKLPQIREELAVRHGKQAE